MASAQQPIQQSTAALLLDSSGLGGTFKERPSDFIVEELPLYYPKGEGEHLYLLIEKTNLGHEAMIKALMRQFNVSRHAIGAAGRKDKLAVTRQWVSVHLHKNPPELEAHHDCLKFLEVGRHANKLRIGHLKGNRFCLRIRHIGASVLPMVQQRLSTLIAQGLPNYFDSQRFGVRGINHLLGRALIAKDSKQLVSLLAEADGSSQWPSRSPERLALDRVQQGMSMGRMTSGLGRQTRQFWISALQSAVFNCVLDQRIKDKNVTRLQVGDLAWKHDSGSVFAVDEEVVQDPQTQQRLAHFEISPSGPMWGSRMTRCGGQIDEMEQQALQAFSLVPQQLEKLGRSVSGARRPLRVCIGQATANASEDEHGVFIELQFVLPPGSYATVALRKIIGDPKRTGEEDQRTDQP